MLNQRIVFFIIGTLILFSHLVEASSFKTGQLILKYKQSTISAKIQSSQKQNIQSLFQKYDVKKIKPVNFSRKSSLKFRVQSQGQEEPLIYLVELSNKTLDMEIVAKEFQQSEDIEWAQPNYTYDIQSSPNDTYYQEKQWNMLMIKYDEVWDYAVGSSNMIIGIIDTGIDTTHPDLINSIWINGQEIPNNDIDDDGNGYIDDVNGWNFVNDTNDPSDDNMHGTHVSGIAAAQTNNSKGIAGIGNGIKIMPLKAGDKFGSFTSLSITEAIQYAIDNQAKILNLSFGAKKSKVPLEALLEEAIESALSNQCIVVCAAGNLSIDIVEENFVPAIYDGVIAVSAVRETGAFADEYSNYGTRIDLSAPGGALISGSSEKDIFSTVPQGLFSQPYFTNAGTSMAAPHVSAAAGLLWSAFPMLTPDEIKKALQFSSDDKGDIGKDTLYGHGVLNLKSLLDYYDSESPTGQYVPIAAVEIGEAIPITVQFSDDFYSTRAPIVKLVYQQLIEATLVSDWKTVTLNKTDNNYTITLENGNLDVTDLQYYFIANDLKGNETRLPSNSSSVFNVLIKDITGPTITFPMIQNDYISLDNPLTVSLLDNVQVSTESIQVTIRQSEKEIGLSVESDEIEYQNNQLVIYLNSLGLSNSDSIELTIVVQDINGNFSEKSQSLNQSTTLKVFGPDGEGTNILNGPNPFNPNRESTYIQYQLSKDADVKLHIYSISGEKLWSRTVNEGDNSGGTAGFHSIEWTGRNDFGEVVANGPYILYFVAKSGNETKVSKIKMLVLK